MADDRTYTMKKLRDRLCICTHLYDEGSSRNQCVATVGIKCLLLSLHKFSWKYATLSCVPPCTERQLFPRLKRLSRTADILLNSRQPFCSITTVTIWPRIRFHSDGKFFFLTLFRLVRKISVATFEGKSSIIQSLSLFCTQDKPHIRKAMDGSSIAFLLFDALTYVEFRQTFSPRGKRWPPSHDPQREYKRYSTLYRVTLHL